MPQFPITLTGNVVGDVIFRQTNAEHAVCKFRIACSRGKYDGEQGWQNFDQLYLDVDAWDTLGYNVVLSVARGTSVMVTGTLVTQEWKDKEGNKHSRTVLRATHVGLDLNRYCATPRFSGEQAFQTYLKDLIEQQKKLAAAQGLPAAEDQDLVAEGEAAETETVEEEKELAVAGAEEPNF